MKIINTILTLVVISVGFINASPSPRAKPDKPTAGIWPSGNEFFSLPGGDGYQHHDGNQKVNIQ